MFSDSIPLQVICGRKAISPSGQRGYSYASHRNTKILALSTSERWLVVLLSLTIASLVDLKPHGGSGLTSHP